MIEIFKTNVNEHQAALQLIKQVRNIFGAYNVNFDLEDCDRVMRVICDKDHVDTDQIINLIQLAGFEAEVLKDELCI